MTAIGTLPIHAVVVAVTRVDKGHGVAAGVATAGGSSESASGPMVKHRCWPALFTALVTAAMLTGPLSSNAGVMSPGGGSGVKDPGLR